MTERSPFPVLTCDEARTQLPELALGILPGDRRTAALAHVEECDGCRAELDELSDTVDALVDLVPSVEPPAGFEQRVLAAAPPSSSVPAGRVAPAGWSPGATAPRGRRAVVTRAWLAAAAAVALVAAGFGGWAVGRGSPGAPRRTPAAAPGPLVEATLMSGATTVGQVYAYWTNPGWLYMSVDAPGLNGRVACELVTSSGSPVNLGWFDITGGNGYWGAPVHLDLSGVRQARLVDASGRVVATARL